MRAGVVSRVGELRAEYVQTRDYRVRLLRNSREDNLAALLVFELVINEPLVSVPEHELELVGGSVRNLAAQADWRAQFDGQVWGA